MCAKWVIFDGFFGKRGVRMGHLRAAKQAKSHLFARRWDGRRALEGFLGLNRTLCPRQSAPENPPGGNAPRETDEKLLRHGGEQVAAATFAATAAVMLRPATGSCAK